VKNLNFRRFIFSGFKITPHLHDSNEDEKALMWPLVELEQTFSQTSHKGAHLSNGTFSRELKFRQF